MSMNKKQIAYILKYSHPKQLYVVTHNNLLLKLNCPFKVQLKSDVGYLNKKEVVIVDEVKVTSDLITVFVINTKAYFYYHFDIIVD